MKKKRRKIVIIGAGPAGLSVAWRLMHDVGNAYEVIILEASDTVGGMAKTVLHDGVYMDVGGHRFFSKELAVLEWWQNIFKEESSEFMLRDRRTSIYYDHTFFDYPVVLNTENIRKLGIKKTCRVGIDYLKVRLKPQSEKSLEDFYLNRFGKALYEMFFKEYTKKLCGVPPRDISPEWGKQRVRGLSIETVIKGNKSRQQTGDGLLSPFQFYYPKKGPGQLWELVAKQVVLKGARMHTNTQVVGVCRDEMGDVTSVIVNTTSGIEHVKGDIFVSTMPMKGLVEGMQNVPEEIMEIAQKLPHRAVISIGLLVDKLAVDIKDCWIYVQDKQVKTGRIQFYNNWSPYLSKENVFLALEYFCTEDDELWRMKEEDAMKLALDEAVKIGILDENVRVFRCYRERIPHAYPGYYGAFKELEKVKTYLSGIRNLYCVGRNGLHAYWNMDKCVLAAWEIAEKIRAGDTL